MAKTPQARPLYYDALPLLFHLLMRRISCGGHAPITPLFVSAEDRLQRGDGNPADVPPDSLRHSDSLGDIAGVVDVHAITACVGGAGQSRRSCPRVIVFRHGHTAGRSIPRTDTDAH